ncbi:MULTISPECIES: hypothetical protein [unclassified Pseudomonas]|uniref:hypothetical protein n=1 Tax=unclassified Pseudomonas TaxID=196821 RepID=UPI0020984C8F|nr:MULTISPECIES: hypothetical protein [unclassified Pseudomonas]MCO7518992.1 hypothetical protein [Pseudomonas sp. 1]MCO7541075.1 hypothetical protein [Pseudomonas sp. VA159-2]
MNDTPSLLRKMLLWALGLVVVLPVMLLAGYACLAAMIIIPAMSFERLDDPWAYHLARLGAVVVVAMGLLGLRAGGRLYRHFLRSTRAPAWARSAWLGLACGTTANLVFLGWLPRLEQHELILLGWPLLGSVAFALLLLGARQRRHPALG